MKRRGEVSLVQALLITAICMVCVSFLSFFLGGQKRETETATQPTATKSARIDNPLVVKVRINDAKDLDEFIAVPFDEWEVFKKKFESLEEENSAMLQRIQRLESTFENGPDLSKAPAVVN